MKSKVQTYDIRDSESYKGIYEMEIILKEMEEGDKIDALFAFKLGKNFNQKNRKFIKDTNSAMVDLFKKQFTKKLLNENSSLSKN